MKKKKLPLFTKVLWAILIILFILVLSALLTRINSLNIKSKEVQELYAILGEASLDYCDGMPFYDSKEVNVSTLDDKTKMCLAYRNVDHTKMGESSLNKTKKKEYCTFSKDKFFRLDEDGKICSTTTLDVKLLNDSYYKMFGQELKAYTDFNYTDSNVCYFDEENSLYVCGIAQEQTIEIGWAPTTYRVIEKAKEKGKDILIYDYYLAINNDRCYLNNYGNKENNECSEKVKDQKKLKSRFVVKNGQRYVHKYSLHKDGNYYWVSTTPID